MAERNVVIYNDSTFEHTPITPGDTIAIDVIPLCNMTHNLIHKDTTGLCVKAEDLVSKDSPANALKLSSDLKLEVLPKDLISEDEGNTIILGTDGKLFATTDSLISDNRYNLLTIDKFGKILLTSDDLISADKGNGLVRGSDEKLFTPGISTDDLNLIVRGKDGGFYMSAKSLFDTSCASPFCISDDGKICFDFSFLPEAQTIVSDYRGNLLKSDSDGAAYLTVREMVSDDCGNYLSHCDNKLYIGFNEVVSNRAGNLISDDGTGRIVLTVDGLAYGVGSNLLQVVDGKLNATVSMTYDENTGRLDLIGTQGNLLSSVMIPSGASVLQSAKVVINPAGKPAGTYIKYVFETAEGEQELFVNVGSLTDVYTAGNGINIADFVISAKCADGIKFRSDGYIVPDCQKLAGPGLEEQMNPLTGKSWLAVKIGDGLVLNTSGEIIPNVSVLDPLITVGTDGAFSSFLGLRVVSGSSEYDVIEGYSANGNPIDSCVIKLDNGLCRKSDDTLTIKTLDTLEAGNTTPVNSDAVLAAIEEGEGNYDLAPMEGSTRAVQSNGIFSAIKEVKDRSDEAEELLDQRVTVLETMDAAPTAGSSKAVKSGGVKTYVDNADQAISQELEALSAHVDEVEALDRYSVKAESDALHPIYISGSLAAAPSNTHMYFDPTVFVQSGVLHANKIDAKIDGANVEGDVTAKMLKSSAFMQPSLTSDRRKVVAPASGAESFRVWGYVRVKNVSTSEEENVYVAGTFDKGATVFQADEGFEILDATGMESGYSYKNLNVVPLAQA